MDDVKAVELRTRLARLHAGLLASMYAAEAEEYPAGQDFFARCFRQREIPERWPAIRRVCDGSFSGLSAEEGLFTHWALGGADFTELLVWPQAVIKALTLRASGLIDSDELAQLCSIVIRSWEDEYGPLGSIDDPRAFAWRE